MRDKMQWRSVSQAEFDQMVRDESYPAQLLRDLFEKQKVPVDPLEFVNCVNFLAEENEDQALSHFLEHCAAPDSDAYRQTIEQLIRCNKSDMVSKATSKAGAAFDGVIALNNLGENVPLPSLVKVLNDLSVTKLDLRRNRHSSESNGTGFAAILKGCRQLLQLDISYNGPSEEEFGEFATALKCHPSVECFIFKHHWSGDDNFLMIARSLKDNCVLRAVDLSQSNASGEGLKAVVAALHDNKTLVELNLSNQSKRFVSLAASDEYAQELAEVLKTNKALRYLDVGHTGITLKGMHAIVDALAANSTLDYLNASGNDMNVHKVQEVAEMLKTNRSLRQLVLNESVKRDTKLGDLLAAGLKDNFSVLSIGKTIPTQEQDAAAPAQTDDLETLLRRNRAKRDPKLGKYLHGAAAGFMNAASFANNGAGGSVFTNPGGVMETFLDQKSLGRLAMVDKHTYAAALAAVNTATDAAPADPNWMPPQRYRLQNTGLDEVG